jgi:diacylglycerol O-acyltransferase / wax synthase
MEEGDRMPATRLSALDSAFLAVETPTAHMHVGWASVLEPPADGPRPGFDEMRDHINSRLDRAPRYRQVIQSVPLGLNTPVWVDDPRFDVARHVLHADRDRLSDVVEACMSEPLPRDRPLWQMRIAPELEDGRIGLVGKAHHCMVDGIAAVELTMMLLDPDPDPPASEPDGWRPGPTPRPISLFAGGIADLARGSFDVATLPARALTSPTRAADLARRADRALRAVTGSARPAKPVAALNPPNSPRRHLALLSRPVDDLRRIKGSFGTKLNDVILAASAGAVRRFLERRGETPIPLKTMVPVSVRANGEAEELGNRISFMFVDLPCDDPDPAQRLRRVHAETSGRKQAGEPEGANDVVQSIGLVPAPVRKAVSRFVASPRSFNLVVSNIPRPTQRMYLRGCELKEAYPVVPLADRHALAIGVTNVGEELCFGLYADRESLPDADTVAQDLEDSIDELLAATGRPRDRVQMSAGVPQIA